MSNKKNLEACLKNSHDWAIGQIDNLKGLGLHADSNAIAAEFREWLDESIDEHDIFSFNRT
jgi:hypothetical protein